MLYIDSDGVGADFESYVLKHHFPGYESLEQLNRNGSNVGKKMIEVYNKDPRIFYNLSPIPQFTKVIEWLRSNNIKFKILTAYGKHPSPKTVIVDKKHWWADMFEIPYDDTIVVKNGTEKAKYAKSGDILIDDFERNCSLFEAAGGNAICVKATSYDADELISKLKEIYEVV